MDHMGPRVSEPAQLKTVAPPNRTNQEITAVLEKFAAQPDSPDAVTRRRMLDVLDDMAEEMRQLHEGVISDVAAIRDTIAKLLAPRE